MNFNISILKIAKLFVLIAFIGCISTSYGTTSATMLNSLNSQGDSTNQGITNVGNIATQTTSQLAQTPSYVIEYHLVAPTSIPQCNGSTCSTAQYLANYAGCTNGGYVQGSVASNAYGNQASYYTYNCIIPVHSWYFTNPGAQYANLTAEKNGQVAWTNPNGSVSELVTLVAADNVMNAPTTTFISNNCLHISQWQMTNAGAYAYMVNAYAFPWSNASMTVSDGSNTQNASTSSASSSACDTGMSVTMTVSPGDSISISKSYSGSNAGIINASTTVAGPDGNEYVQSNTVVADNDPYNDQYTPIYSMTETYGTTSLQVFTNNYSTTPQCTASYTVQSGDVGNTVYIDCCQIIQGYSYGAVSYAITGNGSQSSSYAPPNALAPCS